MEQIVQVESNRCSVKPSGGKMWAKVENYREGFIWAKNVISVFGHTLPLSLHAQCTHCISYSQVLRMVSNRQSKQCFMLYWAPITMLKDSYFNSSSLPRQKEVFKPTVSVLYLRKHLNTLMCDCIYEWESQSTPSWALFAECLNMFDSDVSLSSSSCSTIM